MEQAREEAGLPPSEEEMLLKELGENEDVANEVANEKEVTKSSAELDELKKLQEMMNEKAEKDLAALKLAEDLAGEDMSGLNEA